MAVRVTPQTQINQAIRNLQQRNSELLRFQNQVSSGLRLSRPSDDPADASAIIRNRADDIRFDTNLANIQDASFIIESQVDALIEVRQLFTAAKNVAFDASSTVNTSANEQAVNESFAVQVDQMLAELLTVSNRRLSDGRSLFGGTATDTLPFRVASADANSRPTQIVYDGSNDNAQSIVALNQTVETFTSGRIPFQNPGERRGILFLGGTGASSGSGPDSASGLHTLNIVHTMTTHDTANSGVDVGTSSMAFDTILGPNGANILTLDTVAGTISLNGGLAFAIDTTSTDFRLEGPFGEVAFVDLTGALMSGTFDITSVGTLSVDNSTMPPVAINFTANQSVRSGQTNAVTTVNSTGIRRTGSETVVYQGTVDAFEILIALRETLRNPDVRGVEKSDAVASLIVDIERVSTDVLETVGVRGASSENLTTLARRIEDVQLELRSFTNELESTDFGEAILGLQSQENLFQIGLAVTARVNSLSLADFLR